MHAVKTDSENWNWELLLLEGRTVTIIVSVVLEARMESTSSTMMHLMMHVDFTSSYILLNLLLILFLFQLPNTSQHVDA